MTKKSKSIDGFILTSRPDRPRVVLNETPAQARPTLDNVEGNSAKTQPKAAKLNPMADEKSVSESGPNREEINESLNSIPDLPVKADVEVARKTGRHKRRRERKLDKIKKPHRTRKIVKWSLILVAILLVAVVGFLFVKSLLAGGKIFHGNVFDIFTSKTRLEADKNGRTNVLIFGTSGYAMSADAWEGALLTDSIMVLSIDQDAHNAYMVSLPRDLYVKHTCANTLGTTAGKLNESYFCGYSDHNDGEEAGATELREAAGTILGLDIQYYVHADWTALVQAVDAVGGVDVTIASSDPRGIYDVATNIKYQNGEAHLDGEAALALTRARNSEGGYGLGGGNFDREQNQQKVLVALQKKALSVGTLANPATVNSLLDALGDNLRTNFKTSEVQTLIDFAKNIKSDNIVSLPLVDRPNDALDLVASDMINGMSVVVPVAGTFNYSQIQAYIAQNLSSDPVVREAAVIDVLNGSEIVGLAQRQADSLKSDGYNIGNVANAPDVISENAVIYQLNSAKTATAMALEKKFNVKISTVELAGYTNNDNADFVIVFGGEN